MIINHFRTYLKDSTVGVVMTSDGVRFGETIEDVGRPPNVKLPGETCIPEGVYRVAITMSSRFGKDMMVLYNKADDHSVEREGVRFTGIRVHRGAGVHHTEGCILLPDYELLQAQVQARLDAGEEVYWVISHDDLT